MIEIIDREPNEELIKQQAEWGHKVVAIDHGNAEFPHGFSSNKAEPADRMGWKAGLS